MKFRLDRFAAVQWRASKRAYRRRIAKYRRVVPVGLLVLGGIGLVLATLPARYGERMPGPSAVRSVEAPGALREPGALPEKPAQSARPTEEAALRPPPALPPPPVAQPAWLRFALPAPATGNRPLVHRMRRDSRTIPGALMADIWMRIRQKLQGEGPATAVPDEVEEDPPIGGHQLLDGSRAGGGEELETDLDDPEPGTEPVGQGDGDGEVVDVEGQGQAVA